MLLDGQAPAGLWDGLAAQITAHGYTVERGECWSERLHRPRDQDCSDPRRRQRRPGDWRGDGDEAGSLSVPDSAYLTMRCPLDLDAGDGS